MLERLGMLSSYTAQAWPVKGKSREKSANRRKIKYTTGCEKTAAGKNFLCMGKFSLDGLTWACTMIVLPWGEKTLSVSPRRYPYPPQRRGLALRGFLRAA